MVVKISDDELKELAKDVIGEDLLPLILLLKAKKDVSEFKLAEKLKISVNNVRTLLYRLNSFNLVHSRRKKDKKKGWYIYYWNFDDHEARSLLYRLKQRRLKSLKKKIEQEVSDTFFVCPSGCVRIILSRAMENNFKCPECGTLLEGEDNSKLIKKIETEIKSLEDELKIENKRAEEERLKAMKKEEARKKRAAAKKAKPRKRAAKKKSTKKKPPKKKAAPKKKSSSGAKKTKKPAKKKPTLKKSTSTKTKTSSKPKSALKNIQKKKLKRPSLLKKIIKRRK